MLETLLNSVLKYFVWTLCLGASVHYFANNYGPQLFDAVIKDKLSPRVAETFKDGLMNPFFYNIPQFVPYLYLGAA